MKIFLSISILFIAVVFLAANMVNVFIGLSATAFIVLFSMIKQNTPIK
jgi:hypothetical protein